MKIHFLYPSWNLTALVELRPKNIDEKKNITSKVLTEYTKIEQVGFIYCVDGINMLEMADGELCVNAIFSYLCLLNREEGICKTEIYLAWPNYWITGEKKWENKYLINFPTVYHHQAIQFDDYSVVELQWITHIITKMNQKKFEIFMENQLKTLKLTHRHTVTGINNISHGRDCINITPYIYYSQSDTLICETCCASGSISVVVSEIVQKNLQKKQDWSIWQVSWKKLEIETFCLNDEIRWTISNHVLYKWCWILD